LVPAYDQVIKRAAAALPPGKRCVLLDLQAPTHWPRWLVQCGTLLTRPFGVPLARAQRHPWESMQRYFTHVQRTDLYFGAAYIATGEKTPAGDARMAPGSSRGRVPWTRRAP
jgi:demethylmenaquinone methyltransferase/2-methoxy-6-polyprenyl-1,4-benzoquinol methylase